MWRRVPLAPEQHQQEPSGLSPALRILTGVQDTLCLTKKIDCDNDAEARFLVVISQMDSNRCVESHFYVILPSSFCPPGIATFSGLDMTVYLSHHVGPFLQY